MTEHSTTAPEENKMYIIMGRKGYKAFCSPIDNVTFLEDGKCYYRDIKDKRFYFCSKDEIVENPVFTGKMCLGYQEILLS